MPSTSMKVLVTGAGGRTGSLVFKKLLEREGYDPVGVVRDSKSRDKLKKKLGDLAKSASIQQGDIMNTDFLKSAMASVDAVILCTSAVPKINLLSLVVLFLNPIRKLLKLAPLRPQFYFRRGGTPEEVDFQGAVRQIDAANESGVKKFVFLSSMGVTQPNNFLNSIGKKKDGTGGDILLWKRKAEQHLIGSGMDYTIIHPGGLVDQLGGQRELVMGIDDKLLTASNRNIPREDVAEVCVQCLTLREASNRSLDIVSKKEGDGTVTTDFQKLLSSVEGNCDYNLETDATM